MYFPYSYDHIFYTLNMQAEDKQCKLQEEAVYGPIGSIAF